MNIRLAETNEDIERCVPVLIQLRPHLWMIFMPEQIRWMQREGYQVAFLEDDEGEVRAVAGFRMGEMLHRGRYLYVDDLVTDEISRSKGYGGQLFDWLVDYAKERGCQQFHLDSGVQRHDAHRFYFKKGMKISSFHFSMEIEPD